MGFLDDPATGNLFLLIASVIGVAGSYFLYIKRRRDSRRKLKRALVTELNGMENLQDTADTLNSLSERPPSARISSSKVPPAESFSTTVYVENSTNLGLLSDDNLEGVVAFYTELNKHKQIIQGIREDPEGVPMPDHQTLYEDFTDLPDQRTALLEQLEK